MTYDVSVVATSQTKRKLFLARLCCAPLSRLRAARLRWTAKLLRSIAKRLRFLARMMRGNSRD